MRNPEHISPEDRKAIEVALDKSRRWMEHGVDFIDGLNFPTSDRNRVAVSLYHLCIEHHTAIHTLVHHGIIGSAFALIRPQLEAYIRGAWFAICAKDADVARFLKTEEPPRIATLIRDLEQAGSFSGGSLSRLKSMTWDTLCGFTHGGYIQVVARNKGGEIAQHYMLEHVAGLLKSSTILSYLACVGIASVLNDTPLAHKMRVMHQSIYGPIPEVST